MFPQLIRGIVVAIRCSEKPDLNGDVELLGPCSSQARTAQVLFCYCQRKPSDAVSFAGHSEERRGEMGGKDRLQASDLAFSEGMCRQNPAELGGWAVGEKP